ncbi:MULTISPECIES: 4-hydroxy-tetrahydrodipicolinate synthase [unclassified Geomicrobium]|uniref:4-hydroxy-tetrahydrodipicolinate synthase n=1 Tax=unclassified Geomicrobium TaxID=2628951 RepID=UPI00045ECD87|nr:MULTISPECIES: 4-hydroxy-tetrahydrodipicolinate synthase [unclassified Geomicrobium]GAK00031.1 dihydrodipicolinate synthase [Geomicrobium sp. JCM 19055]GAK06720.1 dihydrodipicolinate synthase [Geomicrobium sp. JCM 19038]
MDFGRIATAMVTPFNENGQIDFQAVTKLVNHLITNGSESLVVAGTTGESPTLSSDEKLALFRHVIKVTDGRVPIIAGTGSNNTNASIELTQAAEEAGVDGIMLVTPYYNKPSQEGMYQHFKAITESTALPIMLYNVPGRTVVSLAPETTIRLSHLPNVVAIKEASGDLDAASMIIENSPDGFELYGGDDSMTLPLMSIGAKGVVSVASHVIGKNMLQMVQQFENGNTKVAAKQHRELLPVMNAMFMAPNPVPVKAALEMQGIISGDVRLPMIRLTSEESQVLYSILQPNATFHVG